MQCACLKKCKFIFYLYCAGLLVALFGIRLGTQPELPLNLRLFRTILHYFWILQHSGNRTQLIVASVNLVGNLLLFAPMGYLLPRCYGWRGGWKSVLGLAAICLMVELMQLVTSLGTCDVDDFLLNFLGALLGLLLWHWQKRRHF